MTDKDICKNIADQAMDQLSSGLKDIAISKRGKEWKRIFEF